MSIDYNYLEKSKILFYIKTDLKANYTYLSPFFANYFGYNSDSYIGINSMTTICEEDHPVCLETINKCLENFGKSFSVKLRKPSKNGKTLYTQWEFTLETDEKNQPIGFICVGFDITKKVNRRSEIQQLTQKIEDNEHKYKTLFETSTLGILLHNTNGDLFDANQAFCDIIGITQKDIEKQNISQFTPEEYWEKDKFFINDLITKGTTSNYEKEFFRKNVEKIPVSINGKAFYDKDGNILIWCIAKDITERKYHEKQLKQQNELLEQTANIAMLGGWEIDYRTYIIEWTKEVYHIYDVDFTFEKNPESVLAFYHPDDLKIVTDAINYSVQTREPFDIETRFISALGKNKWLKISGGVILENDYVVGLKGIMHDITKSKITEETIITQNNLLKEIYYSQSHLMRLPLANILGLSELLEIETDPKELEIIKSKLKWSATQLDEVIKELANKKSLTNLP